MDGADCAFSARTPPIADEGTHAAKVAPRREQVGIPVQRPKHVPKRARTRLVNCANLVEAQVDLDGRIHLRTAPHGDV